MLSALDAHRAQQEARRQAEALLAEGVEVDVEREVDAAGQNLNTPFLRRWQINLPPPVLHGARRWYLRMAPTCSSASQFPCLYQHLDALPSTG